MIPIIITIALIASISLIFLWTRNTIIDIYDTIDKNEDEEPYEQTQ